MRVAAVSAGASQEGDMGSRAVIGSTQRHFGTIVDRGGRMPRGKGVAVVPPSGLDRDAERGPHWGKGPKGYTRSDERTREDVCDAIAGEGYVDASDVEVKVEGGTVTLSGTIAFREHKRALERIVARCLGVHDVRNELRLPPARA